MAHGKPLLSIDTTHARTRCDQCHKKHRQCDNSIPTCSRCRKLKIECTRQRTQLRSQMKLSSPTTWFHAIQLHPASLIARFRIQRYLMPFRTLLPKLPLKTLDMVTTQANIHSTPSMITYSPHPTAKIHALLRLATKSFFHFVNPFQPLFSEESFHSKPRSTTLCKIITHIGLERMPETTSTTAALLYNSFRPHALLALPPTLDTLQCLHLARFFVRCPAIEPLRARISFYASTLLPLLGLHIYRPNSPHWLEYTLLAQMDAISLYNLSPNQLPNNTYIDSSRRHLNPSFLPTMTNLNHFPHPSDRIHFITSQTMYHSFSIAIHCTICKEPLQTHLQRLHESFLWGWCHLTHLTHVSSHQKRLLTQSRLALALRYYNNYLHILQLASPTNPPHLQHGLKVAAHVIHLTSTLTHAPFSLNCIITLIPSVTFILAHQSTTQPLLNALSQAHHFLQQASHTDYFYRKATTYLSLIDLCLKHHNLITQLS
ncbi:hypothetical protein DSO57_1032787 [Entomophthora muscae]|uniref:Uncharacterized protein n=1 Tax=Entomophthora muscae TaxID=34485 RepID=A0ACC2S2N8_9FUNG|nr:hypothetical protein DSO57_1032787 [Entomophthora muscae]